MLVSLGRIAAHAIPPMAGAGLISTTRTQGSLLPDNTAKFNAVPAIQMGSIVVHQKPVMPVTPDGMRMADNLVRIAVLVTRPMAGAELPSIMQIQDSR